MLKNKRELTFAAAATLILIGLSAATYYSLKFLIVSIDTSFAPDTASTAEINHFNLQGYKDLKLEK